MAMTTRPRPRIIPFVSSFLVLLTVALVLPARARAEAPAALALPPPQTTGGKPLLDALKERKTSRDFAPDKLSPQELSSLLWAAFGINRPDSGKRTAPSAMNWQEIDLYVATADGVYLYDAKNNALRLVVKEDARAATGTQGFVKEAAVNLIYVADLSRTGSASAEEQALYTALDAGFIAENVYLYGAATGLGVVARGSVDRKALAKLLALKPEQRIILCQSVGRVKK